MKHKLAWSAKENAIGGMIKRSPGYDPDHGDWEYFYVDEAKATTCQD